MVKFLFYTMNQLSNFFPSNNINGNNNLTQGTNEVISNHYIKFGLCSNYQSNSPKIIADQLTPFMINATANILYWYCLQTNQIQSIKSLALDKNYSKYNQNIVLSKSIEFKPGFKFSAIESNKTFNAKIVNNPVGTLKLNDEISDKYFIDINDSLTNLNQGKNILKDFSEIKLYPNPARNSIFIELGNEKSIITITDNLGKIVLTKATNANYELIDVGNFSKGLYSVTIKQSSRSFSENLIIQ